MFKIKELEQELGINDADPNYTEIIRVKMRSLTNDELAKLGAKYIPGLDSRGTLTFLIKEILGRVMPWQNEPGIATSKVLVEIKGCLDCSEDFRYTADKGCFCAKVGIEKMLKDKTWSQFNKDFHSGKLFKFIPEWCPRRS